MEKKFHFQTKIFKLVAKSGYGIYETVQNFSSVSIKLCLIV